MRPQIRDTKGDVVDNSKQKLDDEIKALRFTHHRTAFDVDIDALESHPWRKKNANLSDYFNFGFDEDSWKVYCEKQLRIRASKGLGPFNPAAISSANRPTAIPASSAAAPAVQPNLPMKVDNSRAIELSHPPPNRIPAPPLPPSFIPPFPSVPSFQPFMPGMYPPMPMQGQQDFFQNAGIDPNLINRQVSNVRAPVREDSRDRDRSARERKDEIDRDFGRDRDLGKSKRDDDRDYREKDRDRAREPRFQDRRDFRDRSRSRDKRRR